MKEIFNIMDKMEMPLEVIIQSFHRENKRRKLTNEISKENKRSPKKITQVETSVYFE